MVALLVRARRSSARHAAHSRRAHRAARGAQAAGRGAEGDRGAAARGKDDSQAPLRRAAGRRAHPPRHRRDPRPVPRACPPDRVARRGEVPAQRAETLTGSSPAPRNPASGILLLAQALCMRSRISLLVLSLIVLASANLPAADLKGDAEKEAHVLGDIFVAPL